MRRRLLNGGLVLSAGVLIARLCAMAVAIQVAWVIPREQYGVGATLWLIATLLQSVSDLGLTRMIVQADDGDDERLGGVAQTLMLARGALLGVLLLLLAYPSALFFGRPDLTWAFAWVAVPAFLDGFRHRDVIRMERQLRFAPTAAVQVVPQVVAACLATPLALWLQDLRVFLVLACVRAVMVLVSTHGFATQRYLLVWDRETAMRFLSFGAPLFFNSLLVYAGVQGVQLVIARFCPLTDVALYAVAMSLTWMPVSQLDAIVQRLALPVISGVNREPAPFRERVERLGTLAGCLSAAVATFYVMLGPIVVGVFGPKYTEAAPLVTLIGFTQAMRLLRGPLSVSAMATEKTSLIAAANVTRVMSLVVAAVLASQEFSLSAICWGVLIVDSLAYPIAAILLIRGGTLGIAELAPGVICFLATAAVLVAARSVVAPAANPTSAFAVAVAIVAVLGAVAYAVGVKQHRPIAPQAVPS